MVTKRVQRMMFAAAAYSAAAGQRAALCADECGAAKAGGAGEKAAEGGWASRSSIPQIIRRCFIAVMNAFQCAVPKVMAAAAVLKQSETQKQLLNQPVEIKPRSG